MYPHLLGIGLGLGVGLDSDWNLGIAKNIIHNLLCCESDPFIFQYFTTIDILMYIDDRID